MKRKCYELGDVLCDMHDCFRGLPDNLKICSEATLRTDHASEMVTIANNGRHPGNKFLVVVGYNRSSLRLTAVYSYDNRYFGMVELKYRKES